MKKILTTGILAHVDAGKTTLSEAILYRNSAIRNLGSVDNGDTVMDFDDTERQRGITIYSSQALLETPSLSLTILDTPGHADFSSETERTISVLDFAVLVVSGTDGVQSHTRTLFELLKKNRVPVFIFVNKMDISSRSRDDILLDIGKSLNIEPLDMTDGGEEWMEDLASLDEDLLEKFLVEESVSDEDVISQMEALSVSPVVFGSARTMDSVDRLVEVIERFGRGVEGASDFGAKVYKIGRGSDGKRLTFLKVTGGTLKVRDEVLPGEKVDEIRRFFGAKYETVKELVAGEVAAVTGLASSYPGQGLGSEEDSPEPILKPVVSYTVKPLNDVSSHTLLVSLKEIEEEDPTLEVSYEVKTDEIKVSLMGTIQREVLEGKLREKYGIGVAFSESEVVYKETILEECEGHGHFEPLRHFADVKIKMIPGERGSGVAVRSVISTDVLDINYQHQIERNLRRRLDGILTCAPITDVVIEITGGKSHNKHTNGGDFTKATKIAVRDALMRAESALLEPYYDVMIKVPLEKCGRAMTDIEKMKGRVVSQSTEGEFTTIEGKIPVNEFSDYDAEVRSYTGGLGQISVEPGGYDICHNADEVIEKVGYDFRTDVHNPYESIYVHGRDNEDEVTGSNSVRPQYREEKESRYDENEYRGMHAFDPELEKIFVRTYGEIKRYKENVVYRPEDDGEEKVSDPKYDKKPVDHERYIFIDGYNIVNAWQELASIASANLDGARGRLEDIVSDYQGYTGNHIVIVYDAYRLKGYGGERNKLHNIEIVFTKEDEKADQYIEREVTKLCKKGKNVTVVTSDGWVQKISLGAGALRMSAREFAEEIKRVKKDLLDN